MNVIYQQFLKRSNYKNAILSNKDLGGGVEGGDIKHNTTLRRGSRFLVVGSGNYTPLKKNVTFHIKLLQQ
jgi:hypothetical protein